MGAPTSKFNKNRISEKLAISRLLSRYLSGHIRDEELRQVKVWLKEDAAHRRLLKELLDESNWDERQRLLQNIDVEHEWARFQLNVSSKSASLRKRWMAVAKIAAIILLPLVLGVFIWLQTDHLNPPSDTVSVELKPGVKKAQLILSDGQRIEISDLANQAPIIQKGVVIEKKEWALNYHAAEISSGKDTVINYNQLVVGRGEEFQVQLSDGTRVWLNSESRLKYPTQFASNTREVELEGEAYFEVTQNPGAPFIVKTQSLDVQVLGTSFNVSAYEDEKSIKTTLVEGKVKILPQISSLSPVFLEPNEQAEFSQLTRKITVRETDARMATSWIDGVFAFEEETLEGIMNKLARWYDISVVFEDERARMSQFSGKLPRFENCNELFEMIEKTTDVNFSIEDDQLVRINFSKK